MRLFIAMLLPFLAKAPLAAAMQKAGGYDNHNPRAQQAAAHRRAYRDDLRCRRQSQSARRRNAPSRRPARRRGWRSSRGGRD